MMRGRDASPETTSRFLLEGFWKKRGRARLGGRRQADAWVACLADLPFWEWMAVGSGKSDDRHRRGQPETDAETDSQKNNYGHSQREQQQTSTSRLPRLLGRQKANPKREPQLEEKSPCGRDDGQLWFLLGRQRKRKGKKKWMGKIASARTAPGWRRAHPKCLTTCCFGRPLEIDGASW